jgi:hypothetical protein
MKVQEALKAAIEALENINNWLPTINQKGLRDYEYEALLKCKSALSEIEKCEQLGWFIWLPDGNHDVALVDSEKADNYKKYDACAMQPLYTSPLSKEWVGLSENDILDAWRTAKGGGFQDYAESLEAKLKALNYE